MTMTGTGLPIALIGVLMALWLVGATVAILIGLSMRTQSNKMLRQTTRLARLLETAPALPVVFKGDGRIEASDRFARLLGLPLAWQIIESHGGTFHLHSEAGQGTTIIMALPQK
ncbi:hypothetical protein [Sphingorhabdus sp.]|jgi:hypothetical protein|uniref:hypothetical protein n=1 Tax=Sphingorhabdus sp. TaxID=1902408 RepID=UPI004047BB68